MRHDVFISHSTIDAIAARALCDLLARNDVSFWISSRDIAGGSDWPEELPNAIRQCKVVLLLYSRNSEKSVHVRNEINFAMNLKKPIIPIFMSPVDASTGLGFLVSTRQGIAAKPRLTDDILSRILQSLGDTVQIYPGRSAQDLRPDHVETSLPDTHEAGVARPRPPSGDEVGARGRRSLFGGRLRHWAAAVALVAGALVLLLAVSETLVSSPDPIGGTSPRAVGAAVSGPPTSTACRGPIEARPIVYSAVTGLVAVREVNGRVRVVCMDTLDVGGTVIRLADVGPERVHAVRDLSNWIALNGSKVSCHPDDDDRDAYRCLVGRAEDDVADYVLKRGWAEPGPRARTKTTR